MVEKDNNHNIEAARENLEYGRDLFIEFFKDDGPLVNLGYTEKQKMPTRRALAAIENEGNYFFTGRPHVIFSDTRIEPYSHAFLNPLGNGGFKLIAGSNLLITHPTLTDEEGNSYFTAAPKITDLKMEEDPFLNIVAIVNLLPDGQDYSDAETLVKHLYKDAWMNRWGRSMNPEIQKPNFINALTTRFSRRNAIFRAGWVDENAKLEFVVETDIYSKVTNYKKGEKKIDVWRRLSPFESESDGSLWIPFGKKPNPSQQNIDKVLQDKDAKSFSANFGFEGSRS